MFPANAWGLHDMHGNVWEWCLDHWHESYEGAPGGWQRLGRTSRRERRVEDKSCCAAAPGTSIPRYCRSAYRGHDQPDDANNFVGFRVVCLPQGPSLNA